MPSLNLGSTAIKTLMLGTTAIKSAYLGTDLVYTAAYAFFYTQDAVDSILYDDLIADGWNGTDDVAVSIGENITLSASSVANFGLDCDTMPDTVHLLIDATVGAIRGAGGNGAGGRDDDGSGGGFPAAQNGGDALRLGCPTSIAGLENILGGGGGGGGGAMHYYQYWGDIGKGDFGWIDSQAGGAGGGGGAGAVPGAGGPEYINGVNWYGAPGTLNAGGLGGTPTGSSIAHGNTRYGGNGGAPGQPGEPGQAGTSGYTIAPSEALPVPFGLGGNAVNLNGFTYDEVVVNPGGGGNPPVSFEAVNYHREELFRTTGIGAVDTTHALMYCHMTINNATWDNLYSCQNGGGSRLLDIYINGSGRMIGKIPDDTGSLVGNLAGTTDYRNTEVFVFLEMSHDHIRLVVNGVLIDEDVVTNPTYPMGNLEWYIMAGGNDYWIPADLTRMAIWDVEGDPTDSAFRDAFYDSATSTPLDPSLSYTAMGKPALVDIYGDEATQKGGANDQSGNGNHFAWRSPDA